MSDALKQAIKGLEVIAEAVSVGCIDPQYRKALKPIYDAVVALSALLAQVQAGQVCSTCRGLKTTLTTGFGGNTQVVIACPDCTDGTLVSNLRKQNEKKDKLQAEFMKDSLAYTEQIADLTAENKRLNEIVFAYESVKAPKIPLSKKIDVDALIKENERLRNELTALTNGFNAASREIVKLEQQLADRDKLIDQLIDTVDKFLAADELGRGVNWDDFVVKSQTLLAAAKKKGE